MDEEEDVIDINLFELGGEANGNENPDSFADEVNDVAVNIEIQNTNNAY
jgi:hypothetical protein